jgi:geranylgeranyl diphosphate synthase type II
MNQGEEGMQEKIIGYLQEIKKVVDREIDACFKNDKPLIDALYKSAIYSSSGGKRVRAVFTFLAGRLWDVPDQKLLSPACAMELVHAASLIMDDLPYMDDSQLRRGKPANHVVFGQDVALLASIGLISEATRMLLECDALSAEVRNKSVLALTASYGFQGLAAGQFVDLKLKQKNVDFEIVEFINQKKTAALFTAAAKIAAIIGGADEKQSQAMAEFSNNIGFAFQIIDDILDIAGDEKLVGKNLKHDKMNFVRLVGMDDAKRYLKDYHEKSEQALNIFGAKAAELKAFGRYLIERAF